MNISYLEDDATVSRTRGVQQQKGSKSVDHIQQERSQESQQSSSQPLLVPKQEPEQTMQHVPFGASLAQRAHAHPHTLSHAEMLGLQRTIGNRAVAQLFHKKDQSIPPQHDAPQQKVAAPAQSNQSSTGLPDTIKTGVEALSGLSLDDVHVHYHSSQPAHVQALAYTQGTDIYVGQGQEQHLAHEAWHVVQQKEGRVKPTLRTRGVEVNDDAGLEKEADGMGMKVTTMSSVAGEAKEFAKAPERASSSNALSSPLIQRMKLARKNGAYVKLDDQDASGEDVTDTAALTRKERIKLVNTLRAENPGLLKEILEEWKRNRIVEKDEAADLPLVEELFALTTTIGDLEKATQGQRQIPTKIKGEITQAVNKLKVIIGKLEDENLTGYLLDRTLALAERAAQLSGNKELARYGVLAGTAHVATAQEISHYREDIQEMGVWGGPGEAEVLARANRICFDIFVISNGKYLRAYPNLGAELPQSPRNLLFLADHYVVLNRADMVDGAPVPAILQVVAVTETLGDCLYEGIYIVVNGHKPRNYKQEIAAMRLLASRGINNVAIETAIALIYSGSVGGLGTKMRKMLQESNLEQLHDKLKPQEKYKAFAEDLNSLFKKYYKAVQTNSLAVPFALRELEASLETARAELLPEDEEWVNPTSKPKTLYRWVSTKAASDALKNGITFNAVGGGIPTSTKSKKGIAITSGAVSLDKLLIIDVSKIPDFKFQYVPTKSKLKEVKILCSVPSEAISKG